MAESKGARGATGPLRVEVIDDRGDVVEAVYVNEITGVRQLSDAARERLRGSGPSRDR